MIPLHKSRLLPRGSGRKIRCGFAFPRWVGALVGVAFSSVCTTAFAQSFVPAHLGWQAPASAMVMQWKADSADSMRQVDISSGVTVKPGELIVVTVDPGDALRIEGGVEGVGLGSGDGAAPDVITWFSEDELQVVDQATQVRIPTWSSANFLVIRPRTSEVRVLVATKESAPLRWHRYDRLLAEHWATQVEQPLPAAPSPVAEPLLRWLSAVEIKLRAAPRAGVVAYLMTRWLEESMRLRPLSQPYFVPENVAIRGGHVESSITPQPAMSSWVSASSNQSLVVEGSTIDVIRVGLVAKRSGRAVLRIREGDTLVKVVTWQPSAKKVDSEQWSSIQWHKLVLPVANRNVTFEVVEGDIAIAVSAYKQKTDLFDMFAQEKSRATWYAQAERAFENENPNNATSLSLLRLLIQAEKHRNTSSIQLLKNHSLAHHQAVERGLAQVLLSQSSKLSATLVDSQQLAHSALALSDSEPNDTPLIRSVVEHYASLLGPSDVALPSVSVSEQSNPDDKMACLAATVSTIADSQRPLLSQHIESYSNAHIEQSDLATLAKHSWSREAPWAGLDTTSDTEVEQVMITPAADGQSPGMCRIRTEHGLRWQWVEQFPFSFSSKPVEGTHARVAIRSASDYPSADLALRLGGTPFTLHSGSMLGAYLAVAPGDYQLEQVPPASTKPGPLLIRVPYDGEKECASVRELQRWAKLGKKATFYIPSPGRTTVGQVHINAATLQGAVVELRVTSGSLSRGAWVRPPASGAVEIPIAADNTGIVVDSENTVSVRAVARLHRVIAAVTKDVSRAAPVDATEQLLEQLRKSSNRVWAASASEMEQARKQRQSILDSLGFSRMAELDGPRVIQAEWGEEDRAEIESLRLPSGAPAVNTLGFVPQVGALPPAEDPDQIRLAKHKLDASDSLGAATALSESKSQQPNAASLLRAVAYTRHQNYSKAEIDVEAIANALKSGPAFAHAASLQTDVALLSKDKDDVMKALALATQAVEYLDPAMGALARLSPAHDYQFPASQESAAGFATVITQAKNEADWPPADRVRAAWLDAPKGAMILQSGGQLRAQLDLKKKQTIVAKYGCFLLQSPPKVCTPLVQVDGKPQSCSGDQNSGRGECQIDVPSGKHRVELVFQGPGELVGWGQLWNDNKPVDGIAAVRWTEFEPSRPYELVFRGPTVLSVHTRVPSGSDVDLAVDIVPLGEKGGNSETKRVIRSSGENDSTALRIVGKGEQSAGISKETVTKIPVFGKGVFRLRVKPSTPKVLARVSIAAPTGLPRPAQTISEPERPIVPTGESTVRVPEFQPGVQFDRQGVAYTLGATALYSNSNLIGSSDEQLTGVSSRSLTQYVELSARLQKELINHSQWLTVTALTRFRDGPSSQGVSVAYDHSPNGYIPGLYLSGQWITQALDQGQAHGFVAVAEAYGAIPITGNLRVTPLLALTLNGVDDSGKTADSVDPDVYSNYTSTHPYYLTLGLRLGYKPFLDTLIRPQLSARTMPDLVHIDRYDFRLDMDTVPGAGFWPWLGGTYVASLRPVTVDRPNMFLRHVFTAHVLGWVWLSGKHRVSLGGSVSGLVDTPAPDFSRPPLSAMVTLAYDFSDTRGLRDFAPRLVPFRDRMEEGSNRVHRVESPVDPVWAAP